jgi:dTDP-4-amino-4,6-dideoxygalactose transaminase
MPPHAPDSRAPTDPPGPKVVKPDRRCQGVQWDQVPFVDLHRQHGPIAADLEEAFRRVVGASSFTLGEEVAHFESEFAAYCQVGYCVGVASGTAALTLALRAAGIGPGDEVIVPAHTFVASALAVIHAGAELVFCDVERGTGLIDAAAAAASIGPRTAAIMPVHLYGQVCDMEALSALAGRHGLLLIEDAAQAHGARCGGARAGSFGAAGCFSFYPSKNLGALGDGGAICTNSAALAARARALRHLGQRSEGEFVLLGYNERLAGLQAALLRVKLPYLDAWNERRRERATRYRALLGENVTLLEERDESPCVYHLFPARFPDRDSVRTRLAGSGVETKIHYSPAVPDQPAFRVRGRGGWPEASSWAEQELSLPMFSELEDREVVRVAETCLSATACRDRDHRLPASPTGRS